eukprot:3641912-Rhodomonas_salina.1
MGWGDEFTRRRNSQSLSVAGIGPLSRVLVPSFLETQGSTARLNASAQLRVRVWRAVVYREVKLYRAGM